MSHMDESLTDDISRNAGVGDAAANQRDHRTDEQLSGIRQRQLSHVLYWRFFVNLALMLIDVAMFIIAGATVINLYHRQPMPLYAERFDFYFSLLAYLVLAAVIFAYCLRRAGVYHRHVMGDGHKLNSLLLLGTFECWLVLCAVSFILDLNIFFSTLTFIMVVAGVLVLISRMIIRKFILRSREKGGYAYGTVIVGSPDGIARTLKFLARRQQLNYRPVAVCPIRLNTKSGLVEPDHDAVAVNSAVNKSWGSPLPIMEYDEHTLADRVIAINAQTVMVADVLRRFSDNFNAFSLRMEALGLEIALVTSAADVSGHEIQVRAIQGTTVMTIRLAQFSPARKIMKRVFDIVVSAIAIVLSSPLMLGVAIAIKLDDHGPVLYKQERIGLYGKPFKIYKFRSMRVDADKMDAEVAAAAGQELGARFKLKNDPRVTKVGHFIRKTSLDELPQFFNSFLGTMSVVGPRPQRQYEVDEYNQVYATRLLVKPGITGPWQVSGRSDLTEEESQQLDVSYVQNWSVLGDIGYIFRTVGVMLNPKGAY
ncbi:sugar transferase [Bifidobacterium callitrichos]|uniref:Sugar transferase n=2 Tax=Bifidobacterium callitrichos TaxID=762209 RepID=A0A5M9Z9U4_9BIFI|nr:sugar transferase [Bifidobacterium callitrichos]